MSNTVLEKSRILLEDVASLFGAKKGADCADHPEPRRVLELTGLEDRLLFSATPISPEMIEGAGGAGIEQEPAMAPDAGGELVVGWGTQNLDGDDWGLAADASYEETTQEDDGYLSNLTPEETQLADGPDVATTDDFVFQWDADTDANLDSGDAATGEVVRRELVFVDTSTEDYQLLLSDLLANDQDGRSFEVVMLDNSRDGIEQISEVLAGSDDLDAVHIVSHGTEGAVQLGSTWLEVDNLNAYAGAIASWNGALAAEANLLFYGSGLTATEQGQSLIEALSALTGAEVATVTDVMSSLARADVGSDADLAAFIGGGEYDGGPESAQTGLLSQGRIERAVNLATSVDIVLIDSQLPDSDRLTQAVLPGDRLFLYDGSYDGAADVLGQVIQWAESSDEQIGSLSILAHGAPGAFALGSDWITVDTLDNTAWQQLDDVLVDGGNVFLFGCNVIDGDGTGQGLLDRLARLTGGDLFASDDVTGAGGDWQLEVASWSAESELAAGLAVPLDGQALSSYASNLTVTVSGTVYTDEGTTNIGANRTVRIAINGTDFGTTAETDGSGAYSISSLTLSPGDVLTVYLEDEIEDGVSVTVSDGNSFPGLDLYRDRLVIRGNVTNADLTTAKVASEADISNIYTTDGANNLTMGAGKELFISSGSTFNQGADVTTTALDIRGTYVHGAEILKVNGSYTHSQGTFVGGSGMFDVNGNFTINGGTFTAPSGTLAVSRSFTETGSPTWDANGGTVLFDGASAANASVDASSVTFAEVGINRTVNANADYTFTIAAGTTIPLGNSPVVTLANTYSGRRFQLVNNGVITTDTSGTLTTSVDGTLTNNGTLTANSATAWTMNGDFTNNSTASLSSASVIDFNDSNGGWGSFVNNAGSSIVTAASPTWTLNGSLVVASGTLFPNNATVTFDGASAANASVDASSVTFAEVGINRTVNANADYTFTIAAGTTIPLGNSPVVTLANTYSGRRFQLVNNGVITTDTSGTLTTSVDGTLTNNGTLTANSATAWTMNGDFTNNSTASLSSASVIDFNDSNGGWGSFVNNAGSSIVTAASPTWTLNGSLVVASGTLFPNNATVTFDGASAANASVDASSVTFAEVGINRTVNANADYTFTIAAGTTIPLGNSPVVTLANTYSGRRFQLVNNGVITTDTSGTLTTSVDGTLTNNGTLTANSATAWTMNGDFTNNSTASLSSASVIDFNDSNGGWGSFVNNAGSSIVTAASPTWTLNGSLVVASGTLFPNNATVTFDGASAANASVDASSVTFAEVGINRTVNANADYTFTIAAGTTIPLGNSPVVTLANTYSGRRFQLVNNGVITTDTSGTLTTSVDGTLTNNGTLTANSATAWTMNGDFTNNSTASLSSASVIDFNDSNGGWGSFVNNAGSSIVTAASPTWTLNGSLVVASGTLFPNNATVTFDGASAANASVDASSVTFAEVGINRTVNANADYTFTIAAGTTIPLGNSPVVTLANTYSGRRFQLVNNGVITTDTSGTLTTSVDGTLTNNGTLTANSATAWTMNGDFTNNSTASLSSASVIDFNDSNGGWGSFVNNAGSSIVTAASPTWTLNGSLVVASGTLFPNNATVTFDGASAANASVDASSVTFAEVGINRTVNANADYTFTIAAGTTIPLGNSPVVTLANTYSGRRFQLVNNGVITTDTSGTLTTSVDGTLTNNGTLTANSATAWTMNGDFTNNSTASLSSASVIDFNDSNGGWGSFVNNAGSSIVTAASPTWTLNGSLVVASGTLFPNNATVTFDGASAANASVDASSVTFAEVGINRTVNANADYTFTIAAGTTIPLGNSPVVTLANTYSGRRFQLVNNGVITTDTSGTLTTSVDGTLTNNGTLTANSATAWTMNGDFTNNSTASLSSASVIDFNDSNGGWGSFVNNAGSSIVTAASPTWTLNGSLVVASGTLFPNNATVTFDGASAANASVDASSVTFAEVGINRTVNANADYTFTIAAGTTIPLGNSPVVTLANTYSGRRFQLVNNGVITTDTSGTLTTSVDGTLTNNGTLTANSATAWTMNGDFTNNSTASLSSASVIDFNDSNGGWGSFVNNAGSSIVTAASPTWTLNGSLVVASGTLFPNNATVTFDGASAANASVDASSVTFAEVGINRTVNANADYTFTIAAGTTIPLGNSPVVTLANTYSGRRFQLVNNGTIGVGTGTFIESVDGAFTNNGTISTKTVNLSGTIVNGANSTVEFIGDGDGSGDQVTLTDWGTSFANLTINATDGTDDVFVFGASVDTNKDLTILSGTLDANSVSSKNITVGGNWTNMVGAAGFLARSGKVDFDGDPGSRAISGSTTFYDLEISSASAQTVTFQSGKTQTVSNLLTLTGASGNLLTLAPSVTATDWYLVAPSSQTVQYVSSSYSDASGGAVVIASDGTCSDGGNNTNWNYHSPTVDDQAFTVNENATNGTSVGMVVANDSDPGDTLNFAITAGNTGSAFKINNSSGEITVNNSAVLDFETTPTFNLTVAVTDVGLLSDTATITINLNDLNDDPVAANDSVSTNEDTPLVISAASLLANDSDADLDTLTITAFTQPTNSTLVDNGDGTFTLTPNANFNGADSFTYMVSDGNGGTDAATVNITVNPVNDNPVAADDNYAIIQGLTLSVPASGVLANDTDVDDDPLTVAIVGGPANGALTLNFDGSFSYTPNAGFSGSDSYSYAVDDGSGGNSVATVTIDVQVGGLPPTEPVEDPGPEDDPTDSEEPSDETDDPATEDDTNGVAPAPPARTDRLVALGRQNITATRVGEDIYQNRLELDDSASSAELDETAESVWPSGSKLSGGERRSKRLEGLVQQGVDFDVSQLWHQFDTLADDLQHDTQLRSLALVGTVGLTTAATAGYAIWALRSGYFVMTALASIPSWKSFDLVPILDFKERERRDCKKDRKADHEHPAWTQELLGA